MSEHSSSGQRWAQFRFAVVGPLLAAPPPAGELQQALAELASRRWKHPIHGTPTTFGFSTIERWYHAARAADRDPLSALRPQRRCDAGRSRQLSSALIEKLRKQYAEHRHWSVQLHYDNLAVVADNEPALGPLPSYTTVRRYFRTHGLDRIRRPRRDTAGWHAAEQRLAQREVRSFEVDHANALWHTDGHEGSRSVLTDSGQWTTPVLIAVLDDYSRLVCHVQWYVQESAQCLVHALSQAIQKRGLPRALMSDNGGAMVAEEVRQGLERLSIVHQPTLPYSAYQNAKQEVFWAQVEGRLIAMCDGVEPLTLALLNEATQAWVELEYHRGVHSELATTPLARYLDGPDVARPSPSSQPLRQAFRQQVLRKQRRSDGTVSVAGRRFEIPSRYRTLERVTLRYARWDLQSADLIDPHTETVLCALYPLDKSANASGRRRALETPNIEPVTPNEMAPLLKQLMADYAATGLPPAYLPLEFDDD